jgi:hypothetical protein
MINSTQFEFFFRWILCTISFHWIQYLFSHLCGCIARSELFILCPILDISMVISFNLNKIFCILTHFIKFLFIIIINWRCIVIIIWLIIHYYSILSTLTFTFIIYINIIFIILQNSINLILIFLWTDTLNF